MSEKLKHTPGPWSYEQTEPTYNKLDLFISSKNDSIGWIYSNKEHDARLIATAPEMLEILIKQYKWLIATQQIYNPVEMLFVISEVREIIEKATGLKIEEIIN